MTFDSVDVCRIDAFSPYVDQVSIGAIFSIAILNETGEWSWFNHRDFSRPCGGMWDMIEYSWPTSMDFDELNEVRSFKAAHVYDLQEIVRR